MAVAYIRIGHVEAFVLDMAGNVGSGARLTYSAVVINAGSPVVQPGVPNGYHVIQGEISVNFAAIVNTASVQAQILQGVQTLWKDSTITGVFL
jgi:hypothetical protein